MSQNFATINVFHRKYSLLRIIFGAACPLFLWMALKLMGISDVIFPLAVAGLIALFLLLQVRTVSFHDKYLSINSILRKRRIDFNSIDFVDIENKSGRITVPGSKGFYTTYNYKEVQLTLANGKVIKLTEFAEGEEQLHLKLKTCVRATKEQLYL